MRQFVQRLLAHPSATPGPALSASLAAPSTCQTDALLRRRRQALGLIGTASLLPLAACGGGGSDDDSSASSGGTTSGTTTTDTGSTTTETGSSGTLSTDVEARVQAVMAEAETAAACTVVASETEGPYPLRAILANSAMVRSDITEGKTGVPLTLRVKLVNAQNGCTPIANAWVYIWHCDKDGLYSGYNVQGNGNQASLTYCRGIQKSDANGYVTFTTIYPGWYTGRITHIHAMVFLAGSTLSTNSASVATTQFAFPIATTTTVYASSLYAAHGQNSSVASFAQDNVFSDGTSTEMLRLSGSVSAGYAGGIVIAVNHGTTATSSVLPALVQAPARA